MKSPQNSNQAPGLAVDAQGRQAIDPTANVLALVAAAVERLDDLRATDSKRLDDLREAEMRRVDDALKRIATLEVSAYTGAGRQSYADPMMAEIAAKMEKLIVSQSQTTGKGEGLNTAWVVALGAVSMISAFVAMGAVLYRSSAASASVSPVPQVVYVPTPPATTAPPQAPTK